MTHALMSPSSSQRTYNCHASVRRTQIVNERIDLIMMASSAYYGLSDEVNEIHKKVLEGDESASSDGTKLHSLFEDCVADGVTMPKIRQRYKRLKLEQEDDFVLDKMCEIILKYQEYANTFDSFQLEKRVYVADLPQHGTVDFLAQRGRTLYVEDLKTGRNEVDAKDNYQMMTYAVGALDELGYENFDNVILKIIGVRFSDSEAEYSVEQLKEFKQEVMFPAFFGAYGLNPKATTGSWCRYCPAKLYCKEWREHFDKSINGEVFEKQLSDVSNEELESLFSLSKQFETLVKNEITKELVTRFDTFDPPKNVRRVNGRKQTYWVSDEEVIAKHLSDELPDGESLYNTSIKTPTQVKKLLGEKADMVDDFVDTKQGNPYLMLKK